MNFNGLCPGLRNPQLQTAGILLGLGSLVVVLRWQGLLEPLERDLTSYAYIAHRLLAGDLLYSQLVDIKPPGIFLAYAAAEWVCGYGPQAVVWAGIAATLVAMIFLFMALKQISGLAIASLGALFWVLASNSIRLQANLPNTEAFINSFAALALWAYVRDGHAPWFGNAWLAGIALALASSFKLNAIFLSLPFLLGYLVASSPAAASLSVSSRHHRLPALILPSLGLWLALGLYFAIPGRFNDFYSVVFTTTRHYAGSVFSNWWTAFNTPGLLIPRCYKDIMVLLPLAAAWVFLPRGGSGQSYRIFFVLWITAAMLLVASTPYFYPHYYQIMLLPLVAMAAMLFQRLPARWNTRLVRGGLLLLSVGYLGFFQIHYRLQPAEEVSRLKYGDLFIHERALGIKLGSLTSADETLYQWGMAPGLYFYSRRQAAAGLVMNHILDFAPPALHTRLIAQVRRSLEKARPAFFIVEARLQGFRSNPFDAWVQEHYCFAGREHDWVVFERRDRHAEPHQETLP